ncbi:hypothetical protein FRUB_05684 [Fimbriiglobus ruber]|uniref:Uncharacterized protein n=1 Tax=Fimbriiglobus ruber TaxID=1908690 RepID=A0A225DJA2_9BACT|nr:hypothetical protein FRUB_05684 [Fimbriiglobus ruber]
MALGGFVSYASADKDKTDAKAKEAKIAKVDAKTRAATVKMKSEGKDVEHTFKLADDIEYMDNTGKVATIDIFTAGDMVFLVESEGQITKMKKNDKDAKITKIDAKKGTATVQMKHAGKDVEHTFKLADDIEYMDSTGKVATAEIFTAGDEVVLVECDGQITKMKKHDKTAPVSVPKGK